MLIQCPDCHKSYSNQAGACPSCGYRKFGAAKVADNFFVGIKWAILIFLFLLFLVATS